MPPKHKVRGSNPPGRATYYWSGPETWATGSTSQNVNATAEQIPSEKSAKAMEATGTLKISAELIDHLLRLELDSHRLVSDFATEDDIGFVAGDRRSAVHGLGE